MRVAVTGAGGRLGAALVATLSGPAFRDRAEVKGWTRADFDLDDPGPMIGRVAADRLDLVIHAAAWTDVDGCAREPDVAMRRNGEATGALARACVAAGASLLLISTNEVFDGERRDGRGYRPDDAVNPGNAYGRSKLAGETAAGEAFASRGAASGGGMLGVVRTAWLFGPGKPDFPAKILAAARAASAEARALRLVNDEFGSPTYVRDLAGAIARLAVDGVSGVHHVVNDGIASRAEWAREVLVRLGVQVPVEEISLIDHVRASRPPRWGVLEPSEIPGGLLRSWRDALAERLALEVAPS